MSEIVKTEAFVLNKINYSDTSNIVSVFTKQYGRLSAIVKGGRNPKSKLALIIDPLNYLELIFYKKDTRDIQIISGASLISHYSKIKEDYEKLKYSYAIIELIKKLIPEHDPNEKLFRGIVKIFSLMESSNELPSIIFCRFFLFFLSELGYEVQLDRCSSCKREDIHGINLAYNYEIGILCENCGKNYVESYVISAELFDYLICLKNNKLVKAVNNSIIENSIIFLEKYLKYHVSDFQGLQSIQILK